MVEGNSFISNVKNIASPSSRMDCGTCNVVYLISCKKCGIQYIGKTTQTIRGRVNNHSNKLKQLCDLYLYNHFNSDGHSIDDLQIMPREEVVVDPGENITLASELLIREEYWYKEICSIYPYGLNDNVRKVGNIVLIKGLQCIHYLTNRNVNIGRGM